MLIRAIRSIFMAQKLWKCREINKVMCKNCIPKHGMLEAVVLLKKMGVQIESKKKKEILVGVVLFLSMKKKKNCFITTTTLGYGCRYMKQTHTHTHTRSL